MKTISSLLLVSVLVFFGCHQVEGANVTFSVGSTNGSAASEVVVLVRTTGFANVNGFQFSLHWSTNIVSYVGVGQFGLPGLDAGSFGLPTNGSGVSTGALSVAWLDPDDTGKSLSANSVLFGVRFRLTGPPMSSTLILIDGNPTEVFAYDASLTPLSVSVVGGAISVNTNVLIVTCPTNRTVECGSAWTFDTPVVLDTCNIAPASATVVISSTITNSTGCGYSATRTWEITDVCSNRTTCAQTVTAVDTTPPSVACPADATIESGTTWSFDDPTANDACSPAGVVKRTLATTVNRIGFCGNTLSIQRILEFSDACGNKATCTQTVAVVDTTPPAITCAPDKFVNCQGAWSFDPPTALDVAAGTNVSIVIQSTVTNGTCGVNFTATRTWLATDLCGNSSTCSQVVTGRLYRAPVLAAIGPQSVDQGGVLNFTVSATDPDLDALTYSLDGGPAGASIHPINGLFIWSPGPLQGAGNYPVTIRVSDGDQMDSALVVIRVTVVPIVIATQPTNVVVREGQPASFNVTATGSFPNYRWRLNGTNIADATNAVFELAQVRMADAGLYSVLVSNEAGAVASLDALLTVIPNGAPFVRADGEIVNDGVVRDAMAILTLETTFPQGYIFYTLDGSVPALSSPLYDGPIAVSNTVVVRCLALSSDFSLTAEAPAVTVVVRPYTVNATAAGGGSVTVWPVQPYHASNSIVDVTATPGSGWSFMRWEGDAHGTNNPLAVEVNGSLNVRAVFGTVIQTNTVGGGRIEVTPEGLVPYGTTVTLRAVPGPARVFVAWGGAVSGADNPRPFQVVTPNPAVSALFTAVPLAVTANPSKQTVVAGSPVALVVAAQGTPPLAYQWRRNGVSLDGAREVQLAFEHATTAHAGLYDVVVSGSQGSVTSAPAALVVGFTLRVEVLGPGTVNVEPASPLYLPGASVTMSATAAAGAEFYGWTTPVVSGRNELVLTMASNTVVTAVFTDRVLAAAQGSYVGLAAGANGWTRTNTGLVNATVNARGKLSGTARFGTGVHRFSGVVPASGERVVDLVFAGPGGSQIEWRCEVAPGGLRGRMTSSAGWESDVEADAVLRAAQPHRVPVAFGNSNTLAAATGTVSIARGGRATWVGRLMPGNSPFRYTGPLTQFGRFPVCVTFRIRGSTDRATAVGWVDSVSPIVAGKLVVFGADGDWELLPISTEP